MNKQLLLFLLFIPFLSNAQLLQPHHHDYTEQDTLRGSITPQRAWWDLQRYNLSVEVKPNEKFIQGSNIVVFKVVDDQEDLQIDLQEPMRITKVIQGKEILNYRRKGNAFFIELAKSYNNNDIDSIEIFFEGTPREAVKAPWDGGFTWAKDENGNDFIATSCQGLGASVWWPNKDHMYDEPDLGMDISIEVPANLMDVSNGRLVKVKKNRKKKTKTYHWKVVNPINNYGVNINIGNYVHFGEHYEGEKGTLDMNYYVLEHNLEKAKKQFTQAKDMMEAFEHWFGPYPFYEDGFKLVEVPYLGMEHQSSVTYGNKYQNGYLGSDLSNTGWGLKFDFIIIHEAGHEWFANNITDKDIADMWIHESFTAYSECLFVEYHYGKEAGLQYVRGTRSAIQNDRPIIGDYDVNSEGSGDMYYKGSNMINMIRRIQNDDEKWRGLLRGMNKEFYHQTVDTKQIEDYMSEKVGIDLSKVFDQYLRNTSIPTLEYRIIKGGISYRYINTVAGFDMPIDVTINGKSKRLKGSTKWQMIEASDVESFEIDPNYYVGLMEIKI
ncbi:M1 family metallopeptidase [Flammeovirga yaeyamensis]|uniref:M1 family metallopeptidase n=1 Tax=Flammeovirga yaeyamensis TaxID=367791 RepID=A0AAX1NDD1_9BACT|nr:M1 family metallopeptidase [Flammeovirga yaeyamensis]MBB3699333.1 aminopeptidase N [Flammeovirga yaeyamensis]NMF35405.1 M1 family metallopeptidase [Flammeovirga yaeyamensis]QWG04265.1 M1 family metallopeptidase [Flammeovirga yaeyamensis]